MLLKSDIDYIVYLFNTHLQCNIVLTSQNLSIQDMRIDKKPHSYGIEFQLSPGGVAYIISDNSLENELERLKGDYHSYRVLNTFNEPYYGSSPAYCSHEWVNVGFHWDKYVCKKCNKDKD